MLALVIASYPKNLTGMAFLPIKFWSAAYQTIFLSLSARIKFLTSFLATKLSHDLSLVLRKKRLIIGLFPKRYIPTKGGSPTPMLLRPIRALISSKVKCALRRMTPLFFAIASCRFSRPCIRTICFSFFVGFHRAIPTSIKPMPSEMKCFRNKLFCSLDDKLGKHSCIFLNATCEREDGIRYKACPNNSPILTMNGYGSNTNVLVNARTRIIIQFLGWK